MQLYLEEFSGYSCILNVDIMKIRTLIIVLLSCIFLSCSAKEQWFFKNKEKQHRHHLTESQHLQYVLYELIDSLNHRLYENVENFEFWDLQGNVCIDADGVLRTDHAIISFWSDNHKITQRTDLLKFSHQNLNENQQTEEELNWMRRNLKGGLKRMVSFTVFAIGVLMMGIYFLFIKGKS